MPCRCCGASRPSKGFTEPGEAEINELLKKSAYLIELKDDGFNEHIRDWKEGWLEAFEHHLNGCNKKDPIYELLRDNLKHR